MSDGLVLDLFAGPGGWDTGVHPLGIVPVGLERDADACATAEAFGHKRERVDVAHLDPRAFGRVSGLIASPPCQGFSTAGKQRGRVDSVHMLAELAGVRTRDDLDRALAVLHATMTDDRSLLALEPLRWALGLTPSWLAWEQVPAVLPLWEACAVVLRRIGYTVATAILNAEQYGVPQTRRRAILVARAPWLTRELGPAALPRPTHSRFHSRDRARLDEGVLPWVSMAEALGWGMTERPSMTVTGGGADTGGAEPFGNGARRGMRREADEGRWIMNGAGAVGLAPRLLTEPAATITGRGTAAWVLRGGNQAHSPERGIAEPAPTLVFGARSNAVDWVLRSNYSGSGAGSASERGRTIRTADEPATAITGKPPAWVTAGGDASRQSRDGGTHQRRVSVDEAAVLQTFPADYPWQGNLGQRYQQVGNAVPPVLAYRIVAAVTR